MDNVSIMGGIMYIHASAHRHYLTYRVPIKSAPLSPCYVHEWLAWTSVPLSSIGVFCVADLLLANAHKSSASMDSFSRLVTWSSIYKKSLHGVASIKNHSFTM